MAPHADLLAQDPLPELSGPQIGAVCTADVAECTCPEFCERDHSNE